MKAKGIRILDNNRRIVCVELPDILSEIPNGNDFFWSILYLYASGNLGEGKSMLEFTKQVNISEKGLAILWNDLKSLGDKFYEVIDLILIACKDKSLLHRYEEDQEMYETCDIVINMFDSSFWEVFSKDDQLITKLASKFKDIKFLESDFEK